MSYAGLAKILSSVFFFFLFFFQWSFHFFPFFHSFFFMRFNSNLRTFLITPYLTDFAFRFFLNTLSQKPNTSTVKLNVLIIVRNPMESRTYSNNIIFIITTPRKKKNLPRPCRKTVKTVMQIHQNIKFENSNLKNHEINDWEIDQSKTKILRATKGTYFSVLWKTVKSILQVICIIWSFGRFFTYMGRGHYY